MSVKEYWGTVHVTADQLGKMNQAQVNMLKKINGKDKSNANLKTGLNAISLTSGIIGLFLTGGAATVAGLISSTNGVIASYPSYNKLLATVLQDGCNEMIDLREKLVDIPKYDVFEIEFPFIHFTDKKIRYVQGKGRVLRAHIKGGRWISYR